MTASDAGPVKMLVVDDTANMRQLLESAFIDQGYDVRLASNGDAAVALLDETVFDIVITDLKMPGRDGIEVLKAAKTRAPDTEVIVITAYGSIETAVEAMRLGAADFVAKPFRLQEIELKVEHLTGGAGKAQAESPRPSRPEAAGGRQRRIIGDSAHTRGLLRMISKIGPSRSSVLITGESGTGKELVARAVHDASPRRDRPFVALNCAALAPGVLESELFGHEKGAFTGAADRRTGRFERAHTGTLFLDEVGEIDPGTQTKLLRVLQEGEFERVGGTETISVDVRIVAATNRDLREAIRSGAFREDFYYRLNVFSLALDPLRKRKDDIPALIDHFLRRFSEQAGREVQGIEDGVMSVFLRYPWPGNARELENVLERATVLADGPVITREELPPEILYHTGEEESEPAEAAANPGDGPPAGSLSERTDQMECQMIRDALEQFRWNKTKAAHHLGLKRTTLQYKIKKYGIE